MCSPSSRSRQPVQFRTCVCASDSHHRSQLVHLASLIYFTPPPHPGCVLRISSNIILPCTLTSSGWSSRVWTSDQNGSCPCYIPPPILAAFGELLCTLSVSLFSYIPVFPRFILRSRIHLQTLFIHFSINVAKFGEFRENRLTGIEEFLYPYCPRLFPHISVSMLPTYLDGFGSDLVYVISV